MTDIPDDVLDEVERMRGAIQKNNVEILDLRMRVEAAEAEKARLGRQLNTARYGQPDFSWSVHKEAMVALQADLDAALARVEKLRHQITEASDPDFIWGALDNVHDADTTLDDYAAAVSRAIRGAMQITGKAE